MQYIATVIFSVALSVGAVYALRGLLFPPTKSVTPTVQPVIDPAADAAGLDAIAKATKG